MNRRALGPRDVGTRQRRFRGTELGVDRPNDLGWATWAASGGGLVAISLWAVGLREPGNRAWVTHMEVRDCVDVFGGTMCTVGSTAVAPRPAFYYAGWATTLGCDLAATATSAVFRGQLRRAHDGVAFESSSRPRPTLAVAPRTDGFEVSGIW